MDKNEKPSILVVDDSISNIELISRILADKYTMFSAMSGASALTAARENRPDLILMDTVMPGMDGFETLTRLRHSMETSGIPVIFIAERDNPEEEARGLKIGAADYVTMPIREAVIETRVRTHMRLVQQARAIEQLSATDELTGLPNRRHFAEQLNKEWGRAIRETSWISLLIIDIDSFKPYNETYGHQQGDMLLQAIATIFKDTFRRTTDAIARWGGEEFTMLLPRADAQGAKDVAERIRASVEELKVPCCANGAHTRATVSVGINAEQPVITELPVDGFVSKADKALCMAKKLGKNRVCVYDKDAYEDIINNFY